MYVSPGDVRRCLDQARAISEEYRQYHIAGDHDHKSIIDLMDQIVTAYLRKTFRVHKIEIERASVSAMYWALRDGSYDIFLLGGLDERDRRFALCKELFHIILDEEDCRSTNVSGHVEEVVTTFPVRDSIPGRAAVWEFLAEASAMEFMLPFEERERILKAAAEAGTSADFLTLANHFGVPDYFVELYCSESMMEYFAAFRA